MPKSVVLTLTLVFSDPIEDVQAVADNAVDALQSWVMAGPGLAPSDGDAYTQAIVIEGPKVRAAWNWSF